MCQERSVLCNKHCCWGHGSYPACRSSSAATRWAVTRAWRRSCRSRRTLMRRLKPWMIARVARYRPLAYQTSVAIRRARSLVRAGMFDEGREKGRQRVLELERKEHGEGSVVVWEQLRGKELSLSWPPRISPPRGRALHRMGGCIYHSNTTKHEPLSPDSPSRAAEW